MLQAAFGGYLNVETGQTAYDNSPPFYEPGYNLMFPLEMESAPADQIYILIRRRTDASGIDFDNLANKATDFSIESKDITNNEHIPAYITYAKEFYSGWDPDSTVTNPTELVIVITNSFNIYNTEERVRVIDCVIKDDEDNFIRFRLQIDDENKIFHYLNVNIEKKNERPTFSASGTSGIIDTRENGDSYSIISPYAYIKETNKDNSDFSYPPDSIFYSRESKYTDEEFEFNIESYSHSFVIDNVSLINVINYNKTCVLHIDKYISTASESVVDSVYIDIGVRGTLSGLFQIFRLTFRG